MTSFCMHVKRYQMKSLNGTLLEDFLGLKWKLKWSCERYLFWVRMIKLRKFLRKVNVHNIKLNLFFESWNKILLAVLKELGTQESPTFLISAAFLWPTMVNFLSEHWVSSPCLSLNLVAAFTIHPTTSSIL